MRRQLVKTFNGYEVIFDSNRKYNHFLILDHKRKVNEYGDFHSCLIYLYEHCRNFEYLAGDFQISRKTKAE